MPTVMNIENGKIIHDPVVIEVESCILQSVAAIPQLPLIPQPCLREIDFPPRAACPPPSLGIINVSLSTFDA